MAICRRTASTDRDCVHRSRLYQVGRLGIATRHEEQVYKDRRLQIKFFGFIYCIPFRSSNTRQRCRYSCTVRFELFFEIC